MADYSALRDYLMGQKADDIVLSFEQIEEILGFELPRAAQRASWWEKERNPENARPQRDAIRDAGFEARRLTSADTVRFTRLPPPGKFFKRRF